jgi:hypothetical protein
MATFARKRPDLRQAHEPKRKVAIDTSADRD